MPILLDQSEVRIEWKDLESRVIHKRPKLKRSSGLHLSGVIKHVLTTSGLLNTDDVTDEMPLRMCVGMAWEDWAVGLYPKMKWQPGECSLDGVSGSPDGITKSKERYLPEPTILEEFKATWKSAHTHGDVLKEKIWMWQVAGYLKMLGLNIVRLHVLWINGDYRPPSPKYAIYTLQFDQPELDRFWQNVIIKNKEHAIPESHE